MEWGKQIFYSTLFIVYFNDSTKRNLFRFSRINQFLDMFRSMSKWAGFIHCSIDQITTKAAHDNRCSNGGSTKSWKWSSCWICRRDSDESWNRPSCHWQLRIVCTYWHQRLSRYGVLVVCTSETNEIQCWWLRYIRQMVIFNQSSAVQRYRRSAGRTFARETNQDGIVCFAAWNSDFRWVSKFKDNAGLGTSYCNFNWSQINFQTLFLREIFSWQFLLTQKTIEIHNGAECSNAMWFLRTLRIKWQFVWLYDFIGILYTTAYTPPELTRTLCILMHSLEYTNTYSCRAKPPIE